MLAFNMVRDSAGLLTRDRIYYAPCPVRALLPWQLEEPNSVCQRLLGTACVHQGWDVRLRWQPQVTALLNDHLTVGQAAAAGSPCGLPSSAASGESCGRATPAFSTPPGTFNLNGQRKDTCKRTLRGAGKEQVGVEETWTGSKKLIKDADFLGFAPCCLMDTQKMKQLSRTSAGLLLPQIHEQAELTWMSCAARRRKVLTVRRN